MMILWASLSKDFSGVPNDPNFNWTQIEVARQSFGPPTKGYLVRTSFL